MCGATTPLVSTQSPLTTRTYAADDGGCWVHGARCSILPFQGVVLGFTVVAGVEARPYVRSNGMPRRQPLS
jgi:hypothetical protein